MQKFYTNERNKINSLLVQLNVVLNKFNHREYDAEASLAEALNSCITEYHGFGYTEKESAVQCLLAEFITAQRGINTITYERQVTRRSELVNMIAFKVLQSLEFQLRTDFNEAESKLQTGKDLIVQMITAALQNGILNDTEINKVETPDDSARLWDTITADANIALGKQRLLMIVSKFDALILFDDLLTSLKTL